MCMRCCSRQNVTDQTQGAAPIVSAILQSSCACFRTGHSVLYGCSPSGQQPLLEARQAICEQAGVDRQCDADDTSAEAEVLLGTAAAAAAAGKRHTGCC